MNAIPHDWRAVGLDVTQHYNLQDEDRPHVTRIIDVFFYDRNEHTHLCELAPSYYLRHLYTVIVSPDETPDDVRDRLDGRYANEPTDDCYMHVSDVDRLTDLTASYGDSDEDKAADEETVREYWQGNCPI